MDNILFYGYYGHQNTGDDAFIEVAAWGANKYWNCASPKFLTENMPIIQTKSRYTGKNKFRGHHVLKDIVAISKTNAFVLAGGSNFHSEFSFFNPVNISRFKKRYCKNLAMGAIGVSLGPYRSISAEKANIDLLKNLNFLALRDKASYELALSYNLPYKPVYAFDLAALLPDVYNIPGKNIKENVNKIIGISICNYERFLQNGNIENEKRRNDQIEKLLLKIAAKETDVIFRIFIFNGNSLLGDKELSLSLAAKLREVRQECVELIEYSANTFSTFLKINECSLIISTRLHAAIFACFSNIPFFLFEYHRKCTDFLDDIGYDIGHRIGDANFNIDEICQKIIEILNLESNYSLPINIELLKKQAYLNFNPAFLKE